MTKAAQREAMVARRYRYDHPRFFPDILNDMIVTGRDLGPGDRVPPFELITTDGVRLASEDLLARSETLFLIFGSRTCPVTESAAPGLKLLHALFGDRIRFILVNVREAHPGQGILQPQTMEMKLVHAARLKAHLDLPFEVAADDIDGSLHRALGSRPNSAFIIDPYGEIAFRAQWANVTEAIEAAMSDIVSRKAPRKASVSDTMRAVARMIGYMGPVHAAAGEGARRDTWRVMPPLGLMMLLSGLFFFLPRQDRGLPTMILTMGLMAATIAAGLYFLSAVP